jgi:hypothetical protein
VGKEGTEGSRDNSSCHLISSRVEILDRVAATLDAYELSRARMKFQLSENA